MKMELLKKNPKKHLENVLLKCLQSWFKMPDFIVNEGENRILTFRNDGN